MDGPPPHKKPRNISPAMTSFDSNQDLSWNPLEINSELPDELNCQPVSSNKKAEDTIQRNHNLSQLLSSNSDLYGPLLGNTANLPPRATALNPQQFRHQVFSSPLMQQQQLNPMASMPRSGYVSSSHVNNSSLYVQNPMSTNFGPCQGNMQPASNNTVYFANNTRPLNGTVYPRAGEFCGSQFSSMGGANDGAYGNRMLIGSKAVVQLNGSTVHPPCDGLKNSMNASSAMANCPMPYSSTGGAVPAKSSTALSSAAKSLVMSPETGVFPVSPPVSAADASELSVTSQANDKRREMHNQLVLMLHSHKCNQQRMANGLSQACSLPECPQMKNTLKHMTECEEKMACKVGKCAELRQVILHWKNCAQPNCTVCSPLRNKKNNALLKRPQTPGSACMAVSESSQQPLSSAVGGLNHVDLMQTYKTLGLEPRDYVNPVSSAILHEGGNRQGLTSMSAAGTPAVSGAYKAATSSSLTSPAESLGLPSADGATRPMKSWHLSVSRDLRDHLVQRLVQAIFPSPPDLNVVRPDQMNNLIRYAKKVEGDTFDSANSQEEYYFLLAEKIYKIQRELEEKRMRRMMDNGATTAQVSMPTTPLHATAGPLVRMPQFSDSRVDSFSDGGHPANVGAMGRCPTPHYGNTRLPQNMYNVRILRPQSSSSVGYQDVHSSATQLYRAMSVDSFPGQRPPNFSNSKLDLPFVQQDLICPSGLEQMPSSNLLAPPQVSQLRQTQPFANSAQVGAALPESQSPYSRLNGPSPGSAQMAPAQMAPAQKLISQSCPTSSSPYPVNGDRTPAPASCNPQLTSPTGNFKLAIKHEDITDDEVTVKSEPRSPEDFKYNPPPPVHEDITDDEVEPVKLEESVVKEESKEDLVGANEVMTETVAEAGSEVKAEMNVTPEEETKEKEEKVEYVEPEASESVPLPLAEEAPRGRRVWKAEELHKALMPVLEKLFCLEEAIPFREPVDAISLNIPDYHAIIKNPMDLSTVQSKLEGGSYANPWDFIDDVNLMFDNAWLYNRKSTKVYKCCSKLAEVFEASIDSVMQSLGYCCGQRYVFSPQVLCCFGKQLCTIPRDSNYYNYQDRYMYCEKCFSDLPGEDVEMADDPSQPGLKIKKEEFVKEKNDRLDYELFVECSGCHRKMHKICVLYMEQIWPEGFTCDGCLKKDKRKENKYTAKRLPETKLSLYLEKRVNQLLKKKDAGAGDVTIRVMSSYDKAVEAKPGMKSRYVSAGNMPESFPYRVKAMFAFEEIDGVDVCFFGMHVQEYGSECHKTNARRVYIAYLDSVHYFQPRHFRTHVYHEILIGYMDYAKSLGYETAHIWACPPSEGDDYIFHCHPPDQKIPKPKRLQEWYKKMLDKAVADRVVSDYKDIHKDARESGILDVTELPYFEGDFWPNILEECIKELDQEQLEKRRREEEEAAADTLVDFEPSSGDSTELQTFAGKKKGQKSGNIKKKNTKSKKPANRKSKTGLSQNGNDLYDKLMATMEKHKEGFFVIRLQTLKEPTEIRDPDPLINCDLMDGRDAFLTLARDKHYEFSSLRRAKYATMGMLYELHNQAKDGFIYTCNDCKANIETRYHCSICEDFDLCVLCYKKSDHRHRSSMKRLGLGLDDSASSTAEAKAENPEEARRLSVQSYIQSLEHASVCRDANCRSQTCQQMKRCLNHVGACKKGDRKGCSTCKVVLNLSCAHAKACKESRCQVQFCAFFKKKFQEMRAEQQFKQQQLMRRRMALMQRGAETDSIGQMPQVLPSSPASSGISVPQNMGCGGSGKVVHGMPPSPPPGAMIAARQAEHTAQRQAGVGMGMQGYPMSGMALQHHQRQMMVPNHLIDHQGMYHGGGPMQGQQTMDAMAMDAMVMQQQQQQHSIPPTSQQLAMVVAKLKSHQSPQQTPEVMTLLKQNPQLMASLIKQTHSQQPMSVGGHMVVSGVKTVGHLMEGMMDDPGGTMCNMLPGMPVMSSQGSMMMEPMGSGQSRMPSQWPAQQLQMRAMHSEYGQQFPSHMGGGGMYGGGRMRMSFSGGGPMLPQSAYVGDELMAQYGGHLQQQDQMQMLMQQQQQQQQRRLQVRPRMEMSAGVGANAMGQTMMLGMAPPQRCATISHPAVDMQPSAQQSLSSFPCSMPSTSALPAQPGIRTYAHGKAVSLPRRPPPHYADSVMMHVGGMGVAVQRTGMVPMGLSGGGVRTDLNPYAGGPAADQQGRVRLPLATSDYAGGSLHSSADGLQYPKNLPREMLSRFVNNMPQL